MLLHFQIQSLYSLLFYFFRTFQFCLDHYFINLFFNYIIHYCKFGIIQNCSKFWSIQIFKILANIRESNKIKNTSRKAALTAQAKIQWLDLAIYGLINSSDCANYKYSNRIIINFWLFRNWIDFCYIKVKCIITFLKLFLHVAHQKLLFNLVYNYILILN